MSLGIPKPPLLPSRAAKTVVVTAPSASTVGPPELPCRTSPRKLVIVRSIGPCPYASSLRTAVVVPSRPGTTLKGTVLGIPEDRHRLSRRRLSQRERRRPEVGHPKQSDVVLLIEEHDTRTQPASRVTPLDDGVVLAGDDVRRGHDE